MHTDEAAIVDFRRTLLDWWRGNARTFPWRQNRAPYATAVAELMLRRTRADQVVPVYRRFLDAYPTLADAAHAAPEDVRQMLKPLGLAWRAEGVIAFLATAYTRYGRTLPDTIDELRTLPGVGDYVGAAIACFSGNQPIALIDTNVVRVIGRVFGLRTTGEARRRRDMRDLAARAVDPSAPAEYHYALLDFGAKICVAAKPRCHLCPFAVSGHCKYLNDVIEAIPHKYSANIDG